MFNKGRIILIVLFCFQGVIARAQTFIGKYQSGFREKGNEVYFSAQNADMMLDFCNPSMFRVQVSWKRNFNANEPWMVTKYRWEPVTFKASDIGEAFRIQTSKLNIIINKATMAITVYNKDGKILISQNDGGGGYKNADSVASKQVLYPGEQFFGFGERMDFQDQRGKLITLDVGRGTAHSHIMGAYNVLKANYSPVPFFMSTRGYGIFFHNSYKTTWDMGYSNPRQYSFRATGGELDYYFIYGPKFSSILNQYTDLTGKSPMMSRFAMGLHVGTYSGGTWGHEQLASPRYVVNLGHKFRKNKIPADILWLDSTWRYFGKLGHAGTTFEWRSSFTDPKAMLDSLYAMHYHMVGVHIRPFLDNGTKDNLLDQAQVHGGVTYPANGKLGDIVDFFDTSAVNWWWKHAVMKVASVGIRFVKTDEGDAFKYYGKASKQSPATIKAVKKLHNVFPIAYAKAPYEKFMKYNGMRGFNQTREGYAGIQRYPYIFAGDWPSRWQYFAPIIKAGLNIGISGVGYWTHCMGGFEQLPDPELYIRWTQFGFFSPIALVFGMDHPGYKEPWSYGEKALENFRKYDQLRYRLIPYIYTEAFNQYKTGMPLMRSLVLEYQNDTNVYHISNQYLFGNEMMICPVTVKGARSRVVYLPKGIWFDYWTGKKYEGKQYINVPTPLMQLPIFIKGGSIIPMQRMMLYSGEYPVKWLKLDIFPYKKSSFTIYDDDGKSLKYQKEDYALTTVTSREHQNEIVIHINPPKGEYKVPERTYRLSVHMEKKPESVTGNFGRIAMSSSLSKYKDSNNKKVWYYDTSEHILYIKPGGNSHKEITISVKKHK